MNFSQTTLLPETYLADLQDQEDDMPAKEKKNKLEDSLTSMDWLQMLNSSTPTPTPTPIATSGSDNVKEMIVDNGQDQCQQQQEPDSSSSPTASAASTDMIRSEAGFDLMDFGRVDSTSGGDLKKPPYSYTQLTRLAIENSPGKRATFAEICNWIEDKFPYYKEIGKGWRNSVRHNLSMNKTFLKIDRDRDHDLDSAKASASLWTLDPDIELTLHPKPQISPKSLLRLQNALCGMTQNQLQVQPSPISFGHLRPPPNFNLTQMIPTGFPNNGQLHPGFQVRGVHGLGYHPHLVRPLQPGQPVRPVHPTEPLYPDLSYVRRFSETDPRNMCPVNPREVCQRHLHDQDVAQGGFGSPNAPRRSSGILAQEALAGLDLPSSNMDLDADLDLFDNLM